MMPINRAKKAATAAASKIRSHWSRDEAKRRHLMAELMQAQLFTVLKFQPVLVVKK